MKTRITKCYLVQILDEDDNEIACEYVFANNMRPAAEAAEQLITEIEETEKENNYI